MLALAVCALIAALFAGAVIHLPDGYDTSEAVPDPVRYNHIMIPGKYVTTQDGKVITVREPEVFHVDYDSWAETHRHAGKAVPPDRHLAPVQDNGKELNDLKVLLAENRGKVDLLTQQAANSAPAASNSSDIMDLRAELAALRAELAAVKSAPPVHPDWTTNSDTEITTEPPAADDVPAAKGKK